MNEIKNYVLKPLVLIGALNWGLVGLVNFDLVAAIFGYGSILSRVVYSLVGISAFIYITMMVMKSDSSSEMHHGHK